MTIAAIIPIGDPRLNGYGNNLFTCLQSVIEFADFTIIVQSHPAVDALEAYLKPFENIYLISEESTWFKDGIYDGKQIDRNLHEALKWAKMLGATHAVYLSSNWYIPKPSQIPLRQYIEGLKEFGYLHRGDQLGGMLFGASKQLPMIINVATDWEYIFSVDKLCNPIGIESSVIRGDYSEYNDRMIVDVPFEITLQDLENKCNYARCYTDALPKRNPVFDWNYYQNYYLSKFKDKRLVDLPLDEYGQAVALNTKPEYLSHYFLKAMGYETD